MASIEQVERLGGVGLLGVPAFDFFVWALDNYARGELLVKLHEHLPPLLVNPTFVFLCMCGGLGLLYLSHQKQLDRILTRPSQLVGVDQYRGKERPGWLKPILLVVIGALIATPVLALAYSLAFKGTPPIQAHLSPPEICKTVDCFPQSKPKPRYSPQIPQIIAPHGVISIQQRGGITAGTVNIGAVGRTLSDDDKKSLKAALSGLQTKVQFGAVIAAHDAYEFAGVLQAAFREAGVLVEDSILPEALSTGILYGVTVDSPAQFLHMDSDAGRILAALHDSHVAPLSFTPDPKQSENV